MGDKVNCAVQLSEEAKFLNTYLAGLKGELLNKNCYKLLIFLDTLKYLYMRRTFPNPAIFIAGFSEKLFQFILFFLILFLEIILYASYNVSWADFHKKI